MIWNKLICFVLICSLLLQFEAIVCFLTKLINIFIDKDLHVLASLVSKTFLQVLDFSFKFMLNFNVIFQLLHEKAAFTAKLFFAFYLSI